jgi:hypothetical protein
VFGTCQGIIGATTLNHDPEIEAGEPIPFSTQPGKNLPTFSKGSLSAQVGGVPLGSGLAVLV